MIFLILVIIVYLFWIYDPFIDFFRDYRGKYHIILWYNSNSGERKYINIVGSQ